MNAIEFDFEQAKARHLLFKSRLRAILYDMDVDEAPVLSHHECSLGKWIYDHALATYGHLPEMVEVERVHADIHTVARRLVRLHREGYTEQAREGLAEMEEIAERLVGLLDQLEQQLQDTAPSTAAVSEPYVSLSLRDFQEMLLANQELDRRIKEQVAETARATERFNLIARATHDVVWDWNMRTNMLWWSKGLQSTYGYDPATVEPTLDSWTSRVHPEDRERVEQGVHAVVEARQQQWTDEYRFRRADGSWATVVDRGYVLYDADTGEPLRMVGSMSDRTEARKAREALQESETLFRTITNASPVGLFLTDEQGRVIYANQTILDWLGMSMDKYLTTGGAEAILEEDIPALTESYMKAFTAHQPYQHEVRIHHADGTMHWCLLAAVPRYRSDGIFAGYVGSFSDITEGKKTEEQLRQYYDDLEVKVTFRNLELERQVRELQSQLSSSGAGLNTV